MQAMTYPRVVACSATPGLLSEGPRWIADRGELLWVDILRSQLHRSRVGAGGMLESPVTTQIDRHVGAAAPAIGGGYVLAAGPGFLFVDAPVAQSGNSLSSTQGAPRSA